MQKYNTLTFFFKIQSKAEKKIRKNAKYTTFIINNNKIKE